jgi:hypothetical protein
MTNNPNSYGRIWRLLIAALLVIFLAGTISQRLLSADDQPAPRPGDVPAVLTITGVIRDAFVGRPLEGATVVIYQDVGATGEGKLVKRFQVVTDAEGRYMFTWRTDDPQSTPQARPGGASDVFPLQIRARHPDYLPEAISAGIAVREPATFDRLDGFAQRRASDNRAERRLPSVELRPGGKSVTGLIQSHDGQPLAGIKVVAESRVPRNESELVARLPNNSAHPVPTTASDETLTDGSGRFDVTMITPGTGFVSIEPEKDYAPKKLIVYDRRGDMGAIGLERGAIVRGKLTDVDGKPQAGLQVTAYPWNKEESTIADTDIEFHAAVLTDADGTFTLNRLPTGEYRVEPAPYYGGRRTNADGQFYNDFRPVPGIFVPQRLKLVDGQDPRSIELRAVPTVLIEGRVSVDTNPPGAQRAGGRGGGANARVLLRRAGPMITGIFARLPYRATIGTTDVDGNFKVEVPKGLSDTTIEIDLRSQVGVATGRGSFGAYSNMQAQWRLGQDAPLQSTSKIRLGTLESDFHDLEIVYTRDANANSSSAMLDLQLQRLQEAVQSGQMTAEQAADMQKTLLERQQTLLNAVQTPQPAAAGARVGRQGAAAGGRAPAAARGGRGSGGSAQPVQQPAEENTDEPGK